MPDPVAVDYKTHMLVGVRANGDMMVIAERAIVPELVLHMCGRIYAAQTTRTVGPGRL